MTLNIQAADLNEPAIRHLINTHISYGEAAYPAESNHHLSADDHIAIEVALFAPWEGDSCLGMLGIMKLSATTAEIKSMHVLEAGRGRGVGAALLGYIIDKAQAEGVTTLFLETGSRDASAAARRLYERSGFVYCPPFGDYASDPESVFVALHLSKT
ncbi:GNAT family N-acetyltransferase [uncultured Sulfitobacter sp.]|uniref:GNAT family N-acetyltransferase n=1 Tax=uncultured Sulfitobacter sp. TaxID=191468 RepID=UPI002604B5E7|nr:GNAT family N-acetyltransferase [uncultured Sulfitobacter sp.]